MMKLLSLNFPTQTEKQTASPDKERRREMDRIRRELASATVLDSAGAKNWRSPADGEKGGERDQIVEGIGEEKFVDLLEEQ